MSRRSAPLSNFPVVRSSDPSFVRDRLFAVYGANSFDVGKQNRTFAIDTNHLQIGSLGLSYCGISGDVSVGFGEATFVRQIFNLEGSARYARGQQSGAIAPGSSTPVMRAQEPFKLDFRSGWRHLGLRIEFDALLRYLGVLVGRDIGRNLVFDETDVRQPAMEALRRRVFQFALDYNERGAFFSDLAAAEVERMIIMKFLMCHRHNFTHLLLREPLPASSMAVKAVEEFIEANWDKPVDIEAMVAVAKVSARSLFRQFRKDRGYSPADFAKRVRLSRAREMLEQSNESASVVQIALRCGFQNPGHFARDYRSLFGELPSAALQRARKRRR
ncbi:helix-turn-helix domain-containing protein [Bradyrhizobium sp.]|uniref:AraC family transcriptional regulator n=1 Tax=Bradyrhizobium sp. TaxID=376 RepID=UPI002731AA2C|nr:helix-turn-helix domain-containing protein [Bradyrhizobium sp.]MDP1867563.1 helix-turn-helix domain-containing protein [Bradyrhizobium sp.]MDP3078166.1 helix-turn-helix domain-containing protein [Bradyrhizobium sp.]